MVEEELKDKENNNKKKKDNDKKQMVEEHKKTLKTIVISVICTLLFIIVILLLVLFCLMKCKSDTGNSSNISTSSEYVEIYDSNKLDNVFKSIVKKHANISFSEDIEVKDVVAVTYSDNYPTNFDLSITVTTNDKVYYYSITHGLYDDSIDGYDNLMTYLLNKDNDLLFIGEGDPSDEAYDLSLIKEDITNEVVVTNKQYSSFVTSISPTSDKHISGYYCEDNKFYVYPKLDYSDADNPFGNNQGIMIDNTSLLYGYYLFLSK